MMCLQKENIPGLSLALSLFLPSFFSGHPLYPATGHFYQSELKSGWTKNRLTETTGSYFSVEEVDFVFLIFLI